jgi:integrase/recombinase XerD
MQDKIATTTTGDSATIRRADENPAYVYLAMLAPGSRRTIADALKVIAGLLTSGQYTAETMPWHTLRYQHTQAVRTALQERYSPASVNKHLAALRGVLAESWRLGQMTAEDYRRAADVKTIRNDRLPAGRGLTPGELRALFATCANDTTAAGPRDAALLGVLYAGGLRRSEAVALTLANYNAETGELVIRSGKGAKDRLVFATNGAKDALDTWLEYRGATPGALFCPVNRGGKVNVRPMTAQAVFYRLRERARQAGVSSFTPHDLRRSFISDLLDGGADISTVAAMAGHANVQTTARYDRRGDTAKRKAAELLHVPYTRRRLA